MGQRTILTVLQPAESYNLIDLATCKVELGIGAGDTSKDNYINLKIAQFSTAVQNYCNRPFVQETYQDWIIPDRMYQPFESEGHFQPLTLSRFPVTAVNSVVVTWDNSTPSGSETLTLGTDFLLDGNPGQLIRLNGVNGNTRRWYSAQVTVQYVAGYTTIPGDITNALVQLVTGAVQQQGRDPFLKETEQAGGVGRQVYWIPNNPAGALPPSVTDLLDKYRPAAIAA
jgi:hypothetical protein